ncbi:hypothetical protein SKAU_G00325800 [Synaphobranchus kaupii]|uniref:G-protein coupled receptors family 1 profile domain-containing protein n=1 Tax=Synaphobranchus kaupii TaxID=118154 RepID=A0A9Q1EPP5_SYNKA|nr:hypothetical protein SKAU_G00325800 [Synaphobranchus kaupii]
MAEMENVSYVPLKKPIVFTVEGFIITRQRYPLFAVTLLVYTVMLLGNVIVVMVIAANIKLHKPMYVMICNLAACDLLGGTVIMTQLMSNFLTGNKTIGYVAAIIQAFCVHFYSASACTIISAMAYDHYMAICKPLHYHHDHWETGLTVFSGLVHHDLPVIAFTYVKILIACVVKQEKNSRSKAIQTCASHLTVCILFELCTFIVVAAYKIQGISFNTKKFCVIIAIIMPPMVNPIIYGIAMKDIRTNIVKFFKSTVLLK